MRHLPLPTLNLSDNDLWDLKLCPLVWFFILLLQPGDFSYVKKTNELFLRDLIKEEVGKESFTAVVITGVQPEHIKYLKKNFKEWTRCLA